MQNIKFNNAVNLIHWIQSFNQCALIFSAGTNFIDKAIIDIENEFSPSRFSHVQLYGIDEKIYESTVNLSLIHFAWGAQANNIWNSKADILSWKTNAETAVMFFPGINKVQWQAITDQAKKYVKAGYGYNFTGLFGVWLTITKWKLEKDTTKKAAILHENNPLQQTFPQKNNMFCSQFVDDSFINGGLINLRPDINPSEITVDSLLDTAIPNIQFNIQS